MLSEETRRKLREMNLGELVEALDLQEKQPEYMALTFDERMNLAVDYTYSAKYNAKVHRLIKAAKFRIADAALVNVYYEKRGLDRDLILTLGNCGFIEKNQPVVFNGFTGSGKSYLACAIGRQACMQGFRTRYIRVPDLMQLLSEASLDIRGRTKLLKKFSGYRLLILDEWLLNDMTENEQHFFFELIERRYDCTSTIFCTQYKREDWHSRLGGGMPITEDIIHIIQNMDCFDVVIMCLYCYDDPNNSSKSYVLYFDPKAMPECIKQQNIRLYKQFDYPHKENIKLSYIKTEEGFDISASVSNSKE